MIDLIRSELVKLRSTMVPWVLAIIVAVLTVGVTLILFHQDSTQNYSGFSSPPAWGTPTSSSQLRELIDPVFALQGYVLPIVLGTLIATGEYRHKTITNIFLVTPQRWRVFVAKAVTAALGGIFLAVTGLLVVLVVDIPFLAAQGGSVVDLLRQSTHVIPGMLAVFALLGITGLGVGTLMRNQVAALITSLVWFIIGEPIIFTNFPWLGRWFFEGATIAVVASSQSQEVGDNVRILPWWGGAGLLLLYGTALIVLGLVVTTRRDVT